MISGLFCCVLVPGTLALHLLHTLIKCDCLVYSCLTVCDHIIISCISKMKNRHGHWVQWCRWVGNGPPRRQRTFEQRFLTVKSGIEKQRRSQTLRGVTMKKVLWGRNKTPKFGNDANMEISGLPYVFFVQAPYMPRSKSSLGVNRPKNKKLRTSRLFCSAHVPDPGQVRNGYGRARGV